MRSSVLTAIHGGYSMDIIMIRHGESEDNIKKVFSSAETKLTLKGIEQIKETRDKLKDYEFSKVFYSPLGRTIETHKYLELDGIEEERIQELNFGIFTGMTFKEYTAEYPEESQAWIDDVFNYNIPKGESLVGVYNRLKTFLDELVEKDEDVVLVTHDGIIKLACCWVFNDPKHFFKFKADNGSISVIRVKDGDKYINNLNI